MALCAVLLLTGQTACFAAIIPANRITTWQGIVGVEGGIPNSSNMTVYTTIPAGASAATINSAISACPSNQVVQLSTGTYNLSSAIIFYGNGVVLRGAGMTNTIIKSTASDPGGIEMLGPEPNTPFDVWTATVVVNCTGGYSQGSSNLTVSSTSGLSVGSVVCLDQVNDESTVIINNSYSGCQNCGRLSTSGGSTRSQQHWCEVKAVNGTTVTIWPPIADPNWSSSQSPQLWWASAGPALKRNGIENLTIDGSGTTYANPYNCNIFPRYTWNCWVKNVKSVNPYVSHICPYYGGRFEGRHCYFYLNQGNAAMCYGWQPFMANWTLVEDCIFDSVVAGVQQGTGSGNVVAYNYFNFSTFSGTENHGCIWYHDGYNSFSLIEGNWVDKIVYDNIHGNGQFNTVFRNRVFGYNAAKSWGQWCLYIWPGDHNDNIVGNVLGTAGIQTKEFGAIGSSDTTGYDPCIFNVGYQGATTLANDAACWQTLYYHGNYDTANNGITWASTNSDHTLPNSLLYSSKPAYFGILNWPPYNPTNTSAAAISPTNIPAGYRYVYGVDPPAASGVGSGTLPSAPVNLHLVSVSQ